ncbi:MAG: hypothetical protein Ta2B_25290 [Termitinemataceae bacterium]|nr:MAG: hypothetical protein Ta2B_25290 [Termitinemataceae bacterium]
MNQEKVKNILLSIQDAPLEFSLLFSGKKSKKVHGLYKSLTKEIIIHNRNFTADDGTVDNNGLIYTAIHEYAHHLHACKNGGTLSSRAHSTEFWAIFHSLLEIAEKKGCYSNTFSESSNLSKLTSLIREKFLKENGSLVKDLGECLMKAMDYCKNEGVRWEDYVDRILCIPRTAAKLAMKMAQYDISPQLGPDNMRFLAGIPNDKKRELAEDALLSGKSPDTVKMQLRDNKQIDPTQMLEREKLRLQRTIESLTKRLGEVEKQLKTVSKSATSINAANDTE